LTSTISFLDERPRCARVWRLPLSFLSKGTESKTHTIRDAWRFLMSEHEHPHPHSHDHEHRHGDLVHSHPHTHMHAHEHRPEHEGTRESAEHAHAAHPMSGDEHAETLDHHPVTK